MLNLIILTQLFASNNHETTAIIKTITTATSLSFYPFCLTMALLICAWERIIIVIILHLVILTKLFSSNNHETTAIVITITTTTGFFNVLRKWEVLSHNLHLQANI